MIDDNARNPSPQETRRYRERVAWFAQRGGQGIPIDDVLAEFGLRQDDFAINGRIASNGSMKPVPMSAVWIATAMRICDGIFFYPRTVAGDVAPLHGDMAGHFRLRLGEKHRRQDRRRYQWLYGDRRTLS